MTSACFLAFLQAKPSTIELQVEIETKYGAHDGRVHTRNERLSCNLYTAHFLFKNQTYYRFIYYILGLNEMYVWFLLPTYPNSFNPTLIIKMNFGEKIPKMGTFSDFVTISFVKCYNKI